MPKIAHVKEGSFVQRSHRNPLGRRICVCPRLPSPVTTACTNIKHVRCDWHIHTATMTSFRAQASAEQRGSGNAKARSVRMCTQSPLLMHALSTERKANTGNDVNNFPTEGLWGRVWGCSPHHANLPPPRPPLSAYSGHNRMFMMIDLWGAPIKLHDT